MTTPQPEGAAARTPAAAPSLTTTIIAMKVALVRNGWRRSPWLIVGMVFGALYAGAAVLGLLAVLVAMRSAEATLAGPLTALIFAGITIGWVVLPLLVFGTDETVDPKKFCLFPVTARQLLPGLTLATMIGSGGLGTVLAALALLVTWSRTPATVIATLIVVPIGVLLCVLGSRALLTALARFLSGRKTRDLSVVLLMILILLVALGAQAVPAIGTEALSAEGLERLGIQAGGVAGYTPVGWIWAVPGEVAQGQWWGAAWRLLATLALIVALAKLWEVQLQKELASPLDQAGPAQSVKTGRLADWLPDSPAGGVALRTLLYWRRDPRYLMAVVSLIFTPILLGVAVAVGGSMQMLPWALLLTPALLGYSVASEIAYDHSAFALHIVTGVRGRDDRLGRAMAYLILGIPLTAITAIVGVAVSQQWSLVGAILAANVILLLGGTGVGMVVGAVLPGRAPAPGTNPMSGGKDGGLKSMLTLTACSAGSLILAVPVAAAVLLTLLVAPWWQWIGLALALAIGSAAVVVGARWGGRLLERRGPELLAEVSS